jgi:hypothetical protein
MNWHCSPSSCVSERDIQLGWVSIAMQIKPFHRSWKWGIEAETSIRQPKKRLPVFLPPQVLFMMLWWPCSHFGSLTTCMLDQSHSMTASGMMESLWSYEKQGGNQ